MGLFSFISKGVMVKIGLPVVALASIGTVSTLTIGSIISAILPTVSNSSGCGNSGTSNSDSSSDNVAGPNPDGSAETTLADKQKFLSTSVNSTWGVSDSNAENSFYSASNTQVCITYYGVPKSDLPRLGQIIKSKGVSEAFFWAYAINEGSQETKKGGGFINHYAAAGTGDTPLTHDLEKDIAIDAQYIADKSKEAGGHPSWVDDGYPVDFVPADIKAKGNTEYAASKPGSIMRMYSAATAAAAWATWYPQGLSKALNGVMDYGDPIAQMMTQIKRLGGDPTKGGSTSNTGGGDCDASDSGSDGASLGAIPEGSVAGKAINWMSNKSNWNSVTDTGLPGIDVDGINHAQCVDISRYYGQQIFGFALTGNGNSQGVAQSNQIKAKGGQVIASPSYAQLHVGDIVDLVDASPYGHTGVVTKLLGNNTIQLFQQNNSSPSNVSWSTTIFQGGYSGSVTYAIRPPASALGS